MEPAWDLHRRGLLPAPATQAAWASLPNPWTVSGPCGNSQLELCCWKPVPQVDLQVGIVCMIVATALVSQPSLAMPPPRFMHSLVLLCQEYTVRSCESRESRLGALAMQTLCSAPASRLDISQMQVSTNQHCEEKQF